jgi:hypothetical protein
MRLAGLVERVGREFGEWRRLRGEMRDVLERWREFKHRVLVLEQRVSLLGEQVFPMNRDALDSGMAKIDAEVRGGL